MDAAWTPIRIEIEQPAFPCLWIHIYLYIIKEHNCCYRCHFILLRVKTQIKRCHYVLVEIYMYILSHTHTVGHARPSVA